MYWHLKHSKQQKKKKVRCFSLIDLSTILQKKHVFLITKSQNFISIQRLLLFNKNLELYLKSEIFYNLFLSLNWWGLSWLQLNNLCYSSIHNLSFFIFFIPNPWSRYVLKKKKNYVNSSNLTLILQLLQFLSFPHPTLHLFLSFCIEIN